VPDAPGALRVESTRASTRAGQLEAIDVGAFDSWVQAYAQGNSKLAGFYLERFRAPLKAAA
jgi:hypothetical protein